MNSVIIQTALIEAEIAHLKREFPQFEFIVVPRYEVKEKIWNNAEVLFGERLTEENLALANDLRWIHTPTPFFQRLCLKAIEAKGNILISNTPETNIFQIGEYVMAVLLSFAKNLFHWKTADQFPPLLWDSKWRSNMWSLKGKVFLQIGLGKGGLEIARRAHLAEMKVWGVNKLASFHPHCDKNFSSSELESLLPSADVVSLIIPYGENEFDFKLNEKELSLMKKDSILLILGASRHINEEALFNFAKEGKFRGILVDAYYQTAISPQSKLWLIPNLLLTPGVAPRPKAPDREAFKLFRHNLRQYVHGNFLDMQNLIDPNFSEMSEFIVD